MTQGAPWLVRTMIGLYTNSSARRDFVGNALTQHLAKPGRVNIAVAFFTDAAPVHELCRAGSRVRLVVRLGYPTNPAALRELLDREGVEIRYSDDARFHPKLYVFVDRGALVGSANLTKRALTDNQEVVVAIDTADERYQELVLLFSEYWDQLPPLSAKVLDEYDEDYREQRDALKRLSFRVQDKGTLVIKNIDRGEGKKSRAELWLQDYRQTYASFLTDFRTVERLYSQTGKRKVPEPQVPLRIEIDGFLGWLRQAQATGDTYLNVPLLTGPALEARVSKAITDWSVATWDHFEHSMATKQYPDIQRLLGTRAAVKAADYDDFASAFSRMHSFYDRLRFFNGGHPAHVAAFKAANDIEKVRATTLYLLHGTGDAVERMARCIFDPRYKLAEFGQSAVQELLGWCNDENLPICNNRTLRSLRWLGFDVELVGG